MHEDENLANYKISINKNKHINISRYISTMRFGPCQYRKQREQPERTATFLFDFPVFRKQAKSHVVTI